MGWQKFHGNCYKHFNQRLSWEVAEQHCRMVGGHLVSIMTPEEQDFINSTVGVVTASHQTSYSTFSLSLIGNSIC